MHRKLTLIYLTVSIFISAMAAAQSDVRVSGTVYDSSKLYVIPSVQVFTTSGAHSETDSLGIYHIIAHPSDSLYFFYEGKNSIKYAVNKIRDYEGFDISMRVRPKTMYKVLKGVTVFSRDYFLDSLQNREQYDKVFNRGPALEMGVDQNTGAAGIDIGSIVSLFQFQKNKRQKAFQQRLIQQEEDSYIDYRFNSSLITRMTGLKGTDLQDYKKKYRPSYWFVANSTLISFYQYILNTSYTFKRERGIPQ